MRRFNLALLLVCLGCRSGKTTVGPSGTTPAGGDTGQSSDDTGDGNGDNGNGSDDSADPCDDKSAGTVTLDEDTLSFDWWEGEDVPSETISLTAENIECTNLLAQPTEDWLSAEYADGSLTVTLDTEQVVSGKHNAEVVIWDAESDTEAGALQVDLRALVQPVSETSRNVLVIGVDGLDGEEMLDISVPVMERLMNRGFWSYAANTQLTEATSSGPGWTSILSGVEADVHGIYTNGGYKARNTDYPSFLYRAKDELGLSTAASIQWSDIWEILENDAYDGTGEGTMAEVSATMEGLILSGLFQVHFVHLDDVDGAGHSVGFLASESDYYETVQEADGMIGDMLDAILDRADIENESWLILVTSDHGGDEWGSHGTMTSDYQTIPLIVASPGLSSTQLDDGEGTHMDIHPTVIDFLGLNSSDYGLDGTSWWGDRESDCDDGADNDGDGDIDCDDSDCEGDAACTETDCDDGSDNDGDGDIDCDDSDCDTNEACMECPAYDLADATGVSVDDDVPFEENALTGSCGGDGWESTYLWTAPDDGRYSFDTVGAYRDTVLYAFDGACDGDELACSDDIDGLGSGRSGFSLDVESGDELVIVVDSYSKSESATSVLSIHPYTSSCPDGDLGDETGTWTGKLTYNDQAHLEGCAPTVSNLEFTWTAPEDGLYTYSTTGSDFDTVIYVLDECGGEELDCNDDYAGLLSQVTIAASEGDEFIIGIGGFDDDEGEYSITIE